MRLIIAHETRYKYAKAPERILQVLRLTPRHHDGQYVARWRLEPSFDCRLEEHEDAFGNIIHAFTAQGPVGEFSVRAQGEVETFDTAGVIRGAVERFPPELFLRETQLTRPDGDIRQLGADAARSGGGILERLHGLLTRLHGEIAFDTDPTHVHTTAAEAFSLKRGVCQDLTHIFIAAARAIGVPARYVGGHLHRADGKVEQVAGHAWAEAFVPGLGWVGFDAANGVCVTDRHVRIAVGLDYLGASPVRGARYGGGHEELAVTVRVEDAASQSQSQWQS